MENREMFEEIAALIGSIAKAFELSDGDVVAAIERGDLGMEMLTDDEGQNCVEVTHSGRVARIYPGAIFRVGDQPQDKEEECGSGCSCGH
ncbi:hypothetical protein CCC_03338 [Paramagnetospirillum magnetotacticum MS-1]|uniref:Uncharacterized protein n=1 Tax=Paramagnetospirillum magnetotacticum MS-1 TaxID=272627 RepID=A0A0C2YWT0_PARME|nr:hypothetical protein [Paramagnetospirillum magnetotacticum]KIL99120.1 hypothetical protein CCC_03338 [Paramagnetospirillum magnetotacticum MS-1]